MAAAEGIFGGMSGSPILLDDGRVIGVVCTSTEPEVQIKSIPRLDPSRTR
jgi:V8-like Glu-specific endopeptidase